MINSILDKGIRSCTGCGACQSVCKSKAISFSQLNENGFFSPKINEQTCISCGICKTVCYKFLPQAALGMDYAQSKFYAAKSTTVQTIASCSSGGIAHELAQYGVKNGYIVAGAIYDYKSNIARTILVKGDADLEKIKGSKYLQSKTADVFTEIVLLAKENAACKFMVFGTPCQILGIKKTFEQLRLKNEILLIDLFCHGVPSYLVWEKYLQECDICTADSVQFRDKNFPWHEFALTVRSKQTQKTSRSGHNDFYAFFFDDVCLNAACSDCLNRKKYSSADLRLGDFWGERFSKDVKGVSLIEVNTNAGQELLNCLNSEKKLHILCEVSSAEAWKVQAREDYKTDKETQIAFSALKTGKSLAKTIKEYRKSFSPKRKIVLALKKILSFMPVRLRVFLRRFI